MPFSSIRKYEGGFTLVELAIVLMIVGLLLAGIIRGQEMLENTRITSTIQQTKAYDSATTTFRDAYGTVPGDLLQPNLRLPNCTGNCLDPGDGDKRVGVDLTSRTGNYSAEPKSENRRYWLHLAVVGLITGLDISASAKPQWGAMFPAAKMGGGFQVTSANLPVEGSAPAASGFFLVLRNSPDDSNSVKATEGAGVSALTALRAAQIDRKLDDGLPDTGDVLGLGDKNCSGNGTYDETTEGLDCNLLIRIQN